MFLQLNATVVNRNFSYSCYALNAIRIILTNLSQYFYYSLKMSENLWFSDVFWGYNNGVLE